MWLVECSRFPPTTFVIVTNQKCQLYPDGAAVRFVQFGPEPRGKRTYSRRRRQQYVEICGQVVPPDPFRGGLYRCREYLRFAREHGVVRSMSGRGSCYDNAVIESHFGNLKGRLGRLDRVPADKAAEMIDEAVRYFNEERILLKLGGLSPAEFLREYEKRPERGRKSAADI